MTTESECFTTVVHVFGKPGVSTMFGDEFERFMCMKGHAWGDSDESCPGDIVVFHTETESLRGVVHCPACGELAGFAVGSA